MRKDFAIFILTHGRPDKQYTYHALDKARYTGRRIFLLDDEDETYSSYRDNFPNDEIILFDKQSYIDTSDTGTNVEQRKCILYAKNAADDIAKDLGLSAYVVADDDIIRFRHRWKEGETTHTQEVRNLNEVSETYVKFMEEGNIAAISFGDARLYMGGKLLLGRIPYNFVYRLTSIPYEWRSSMYEDTVTPVIEASNGAYTLGLPDIQFDMKQCDSKAIGGMTDVYATMPVLKRAEIVLMYHPAGIMLSDTLVGFELTKNNVFPNLISTAFKK